MATLFSDAVGFFGPVTRNWANFEYYRRESEHLRTNLAVNTRVFRGVKDRNS